MLRYGSGMVHRKLLFWSVAVGLGIGAGSAWARLGETRAECITRYGQPIETNDMEMVFHKNSITVTAKFDEADHTVELRFRGAPLEHWQAAQELVRRDLGTTEEKHTTGHRSWYSPDGSSYAHWVAGSLVIRSADRSPPPEGERRVAHEDAEHWKAHQKEVLDKIDGF